MKKSIAFYPANFLAAVALVFLTSACTRLVENPKGSLIRESFFKTEAELNAAVIAVYFPLTEDPWAGFGSTRIWVPLMGGDDLTTHPGSNKQDFKEFDIFNASSLNLSLKTAAWAQPYKVVFAANNVMENYSKVTGDSVKIKKAVAQARFLRAFAYFWMVRIFGDIPLVTSTERDYGINKSSVKDIYTFIIDDLEFAEQHLPPAWDKEPGKPTVWATKSMLAQVYLTMAGWPLNDHSKYALAAEKAKEVIDQSGHTLLTNFGDVFLVGNKNSNEVVWAIQFCKLETCGVPYVMTHGGSPTMPGEEGGWDDLFFEAGFYNRFPAGARKEATFHTIFKNTIPFANSVTKHPYIKKYRDGGAPESQGFEPGGFGFFTSRNLIYLRFAEVLLIYAEAQAMSAGVDATAYAAVNKVRKRAGLGDLPSGLSQLAFRDAVIDERGWELAGEFSRWFDLVRTEKVEEMNALKDPVDLPPSGNIGKQHYLAPIPYSETLLNPNLK
jgi:hypothetical protein